MLPPTTLQAWEIPSSTQAFETQATWDQLTVTENKAWEDGGRWCTHFFKKEPVRSWATPENSQRAEKLYFLKKKIKIAHDLLGHPHQSLILLTGSSSSSISTSWTFSSRSGKKIRRLLLFWYPGYCHHPFVFSFGTPPPYIFAQHFWMRHLYKDGETVHEEVG